MGVLGLLQCHHQPSPARVTLQVQTHHRAPAKLTPNTDPQPRSSASSVSPLTLLSFQMHYWEACKVAAASWSRTLQSAPFPTLCCPVLCINPLSGNAGLQTLPVLSDLGFLSSKMKAVVGDRSLELNFTA